MSDTPRTDAVLEANKALGYGHIVEVPEGHPPHDPWTLARELEREISRKDKSLAALIEWLEAEAESASQSADSALDRSAQNYWIGVDGANTNAASKLTNILHDIDMNC